MTNFINAILSHSILIFEISSRYYRKMKIRMLHKNVILKLRKILVGKKKNRDNDNNEIPVLDI